MGSLKDPVGYTRPWERLGAACSSISKLWISRLLVCIVEFRLRWRFLDLEPLLILRGCKILVVLASASEASSESFRDIGLLSAPDVHGRRVAPISEEITIRAVWCTDSFFSWCVFHFLCVFTLACFACRCRVRRHGRKSDQAALLLFPWTLHASHSRRTLRGIKVLRDCNGRRFPKHLSHCRCDR